MYCLTVNKWLYYSSEKFAQRPRDDIGRLRAGLLRLQRLLRATTGRYDDAMLTVRRLEDDRDLADDFRATLKDIRSRGEARIILDCDWNKVELILQQVLATYCYQ